MAEVNVTPELRFPEFTDNWTHEKFGNFVSGSAFGPRFSSSFYSEEGNVATLRTTDMDLDGNINYETMPKADLNLSDYEEHILENNDLIISRSGTIGITGVFQKQSYPTLPGAFLIRFRLLLEKLNPSYVKYLFNSSLGRYKLESLSAGGVQKNLTGTSVKALGLFLPQITEQQKIASFLTAVDEQIQLLQKKKAKLEEYKKGVMQKLFSQEIRFKDENGNEFPDWEVKRLGEILQLRNGYAFKSSTYTENGHFKIITISNVQDGELDVEECKMINVLPNDLKGHQILKKGDLLVSLTGNVGRIAIVDQENCLLNQRVGKLEIDEKIKSFLYQLLRRGHFLNRMVSLAQGGAQPNLSKGDIDNYQIALPTEEERNRITSFLDSIDNTIKLVSDEAHKTVLFKLGLLQKMFV